MLTNASLVVALVDLLASKHSAVQQVGVRAWACAMLECAGVQWL